MKRADLDLYTDYLLSTFGFATATGLSAMVEGEVSHDQVTRFLSGQNFTSKDLWQQVKSVVRSVENNEGVLIFDDTIQEKAWTDENELMCWHYDHVSGRNVRGWLKGYAKEVLVARQIYTNKDGSAGKLHLVCSDLTCSYDAIATSYQKRWKVEVFHKSLKSNANLAKSPTRTLRTQSNHVFLSICAAFKLECLSLKTKRLPPERR